MATPKRTYSLEEKLNNFTGFSFSIDKLDETAAFRVTYDTLLDIFAGSGSKTKVSLTDTTEGYLAEKSKFGDEFSTEITNQEANERWFTTFKGWIFNGTRTFKHILQSNATADRIQTLQDNDGEIALLSDVVTVHNDMTGLNDGDYKHLTASEYADLGNTASDEVTLADASVETPSGVPLLQNIANEEYTASITAILDELARLASASASIVGENIPILISTTETAIPFITTSPSSDTDIIELDDVTDTISMKKAGRYNWLTSLEIENSSNNTDYTATIRTRRVSDNLLLTTRDISIPKKTTRTDFRAVLYDLPDGDEPQDVYLTIQGTSSTNLSLTKYESTLSVGGVVGASSDINVKVSSDDTTTGKLFDKIKFGDEFTVETVNPSGNENLLTKFKGWIFNSARSFKHIISSIATADRTQILQDKDGTIALLSDVLPTIYKSSGRWATLNNEAENILALDLNRSQIFVQKAGIVSQIKFYIEYLGTNTNGLEINFVNGSNDVLANDYTVLPGWNTMAVLQNTTVAENDEIQLAVRTATGDNNVGDFSVYITVD